MDNIVKFIEELENLAWEEFKYHNILCCNLACYVHNRLAIDLGLPDMLYLWKDYDLNVWKLEKTQNKKDVI